MYDLQKNDLLTIPDDVKLQENIIVEKAMLLDTLKSAKKKIERRMLSQVYQELDADGKPKFKNETARETETDQRCSLDAEYLQLIQQEVDALQASKLAQIERDYLDRKLKALGILVRLLEVER